jgi:stage II sporulation protein D
MTNPINSAIKVVFEHLKIIGRLYAFRCALMGVSILLSTDPKGLGQVRVGLETHQSISSLMLSPTEGSYFILSELDTLYRFRSDDALSVALIGNELVVKTIFGFSDTLQEVQIVGSRSKPAFKLRCDNDPKEHIYYQGLKVSVDSGKIQLVNLISIERYVARVVQAEVGFGANEEYYKIQSIICRTYAVRNLERHSVEGYDVCDHEHCQVYSGLKTETNEVIKATAATAGLVMTSKENDLILSAFHANCGGQTANSEDVWKESRSYLTSVEDTFCLSARSATWNKQLPVTDFLAQLGFATDTSGLDGWKFDQPDRKKYFKFKSDSIETSKMRRLLQLRSTYFDAENVNGKVTLNGRGYGHGVGLCQQGAMKMAEHGYNYSQILGYYYKGVGLVPISALKP